METSVQLVLVQPPTIHGEGGGGYKMGGGTCEVLPLRKGGAQKVSDPRFTHFVAPPPRTTDYSFKKLRCGKNTEKSTYIQRYLYFHNRDTIHFDVGDATHRVEC